MFKALVIDDDAVVAKTVHRLLRQVLPATWAVLHETDAKIALSSAVIDNDVWLVIVDLVMPKLGGEELIEVALARRPSLRGRIIVCSGWWYEVDQARRLFHTLGCERLDKPFRLEQLEQLVWKILTERPPIEDA